MERLYLDKVKDKIKADSIDQIKDWCKNRNLKIYDDGFAAFVLDFEFELAYDFEYITMLIEEYDGDWFEYYTNRESKTHVPKSKISEITNSYPAIKSGTNKHAMQSSVLSNLDNQTFTIKEAAAKLAVCDKTIRNAIKSGDLAADISNRGKANRRYIISVRALDNYLMTNKEIASRNKVSNKNSLKNFHKAA